MNTATKSRRRSTLPRPPLLRPELGADVWGLWRARGSLRRTPAGDGHSVIVAPGLLTSDSTTIPLRRFLASKGYDVKGWGLGVNRGSERQFDHLIQVVRREAESSGAPVSLIGWSLGGIGCRWATHNAPEVVRQVITLGSPFMLDPRTQPFFPVYRRVSGIDPDYFTPERLAAVRGLPPRPTTSIVSTEDRVVRPSAGRQPATGTSETIEITGSHSGLVVNAEVWRLVANRLAQPVDEWRPYAG